MRHPDRLPRRRQHRRSLGLQRREVVARAIRACVRSRWSAASATKPTSPLPISPPTSVHRHRPPQPRSRPRNVSALLGTPVRTPRVAAPPDRARNRTSAASSSTGWPAACNTRPSASPSQRDNLNQPATPPDAALGQASTRGAARLATLRQRLRSLARPDTACHARQLDQLAPRGYECLANSNATDIGRLTRLADSLGPPEPASRAGARLCRSDQMHRARSCATANAWNQARRSLSISRTGRLDATVTAIDKDDQLIPPAVLDLPTQRIIGSPPEFTQTPLNQKP